MANFVSTMFNSGAEFEEFLKQIAKSIGLSLTYDTSNGNIYLKNEKEEILGTVRLSTLLTAAIKEEADRAKEAESANATAISNEVTRAKEAESANATAISNLETWKEKIVNENGIVKTAALAFKANSLKEYSYYYRSDEGDIVDGILTAKDDISSFSYAKAYAIGITKSGEVYSRTVVLFGDKSTIAEDGSYCQRNGGAQIKFYDSSGQLYTPTHVSIREL